MYADESSGVRLLLKAREHARNGTRRKRNPMSCPECGGGDRRPIAPGYFECTSLRTEAGTMLLPNGPDGTLELGPAQIQVVCGNWYRAAPPVSRVVE